jgi:hypothetical protein
MERKNISYLKGISRSPSDILCQDGELAECIYLEVRNEELVPMELPFKLDFSIDSSEHLIMVHNTKAGVKNYFTATGKGISAFQVSGGTKTILLSQDIGKVTSIQYVGNSVVAYTEDSPHYFIYTKGSYKYLGTQIPEVKMSFELQGNYAMSEVFQVVAPNLDYSSSEYQSDVVSQLLAQVNSYVSKQIDNEGKFMYPFFVRYAIRLFDGTYCRHSNPILMLPSTNISPFASFSRESRNTTMRDRTYDTQIGAFVSDLFATVEEVSSNLSDWSSIISGVDIFVSKQIYTYDQNGQTFGDATLGGSKFIGKYNGISTIWDAYSLMASKNTIEKKDQHYLERWWIPTKGKDAVYEEITNTSNFYKISSLDLSDIVSGRSIQISGEISSIETREDMQDDYMTHDVFVPKYTYVFNGRLNISNIERKVFSGFQIHNMVPMVKSSPTDGFGYGLQFGYYDVYVHIHSSDGQGDIVVRSGTGDYGSIYGGYFYYPDPDAYKMVIVNNTSDVYAEIPLSEHPLLNGSYAFIGFSALEFSSGTYSSTARTTESVTNKLFTSEVNNIFHFPLEGINTIGSGDIIGMAAMTRPISTGQAGEVPFIVFCTDGNYALQVSNEGLYERVYPVQEDIVLGHDKITPMENSIAVITKKGFMITDAGEMAKMAASMDGATTDISFLESALEEAVDFKSLINDSRDTASFLSYLESSRMAYDYSSNRMIIYNPDKTYSYVYSFENGTVSKMSMNGKKIVASVIDYPDTIIQDEDGSLYSLYEKEDINERTDRRFGFALTRPLKLDNPVVYKAIYQILNLKNCEGDSYVKYALYGSMEGNIYTHVRSLRGRSFLYYRIAFFSNLLPKEGFTGTIISFDYRLSHKLRNK